MLPDSDVRFIFAKSPAKPTVPSNGAEELALEAIRDISIASLKLSEAWPSSAVD